MIAKLALSRGPARGGWTDPPVWFQVDPGREPLTSAAIPVLGLVIGCDQIGYYTDAKISLEELTKRIVFMSRPKA